MAKGTDSFPQRQTAKPLSPGGRMGTLPKPPPGQSNNPTAVKKAAKGGTK